MEADISVILRRTLQKRKEKNRHYSLRAFARDLDISPSYLCEVLKNKHTLSSDKELRIRRALDVAPAGEMKKILKYMVSEDDLPAIEGFLNQLHSWKKAQETNRAPVTAIEFQVGEDASAS